MHTFEFVPVQPQAFHDLYVLAEDTTTVGELLAGSPALSLEPLTEEHLRVKVRRHLIKIVEPAEGTPLFVPPGVRIGNTEAQSGPAVATQRSPEPATAPDESGSPAAATHPEQLSERQAVLIAHDADIDRAAAYLRSGLSVLVSCDKLLVEHLAREIAGRSGRVPRIVRAEPEADGEPLPGMGQGRRAGLMDSLEAALAAATEPGDIVVVPNLDLFAGSTDQTLTREARELTDVLYERGECILLGFTDPSLTIPEVLANRFAVRVPMEILRREVRGPGGPIPIGQALVTREEAELFAGFDADGLYKHIAGMNAVRLRHALRFAYHQHRPDAVRDAASPAMPTYNSLLDELREFKVRTSSSSFTVPRTQMSEIGGYEEAKAELIRAIDIVRGAIDLPKKLRNDLVPRGFIFHGPPGTGKTLFAKAVAARLGGTIQVVSGPEITSKYVGESERSVREMFAEARRNAPAVLVFDEFESIAARRTGRDDGGSRAGNAIVAQLLTELDGFRPEVPVLVIGTTNRIELIDEALLRPSRFRAIKIDLPLVPARRRIAEVHAEHFEFGELDGALLDAIANATDGLNGDEIRSVFRDVKADELVDGTGDLPVAYRFGRRIGEILRALQERAADRVQADGHGTATPRERPMHPRGGAA